MGGEAEGLSYCSKRAIFNYFNSAGGLTCLGDGARSVTYSGYTESGTDSYDGTSTGTGTGTETGTGTGTGSGECTYNYQCIGLWDMSESWGGGNLNRNFPASGCFNGVPYYKSNDFYFYRQSNGMWAVNAVLDDTATGYVWCSVGGDDPTVCSNHMMYWTGR